MSNIVELNPRPKNFRERFDSEEAYQTYLKLERELQNESWEPILNFEEVMQELFGDLFGKVKTFFSRV